MLNSKRSQVRSRPLPSLAMLAFEAGQAHQFYHTYRPLLPTERLKTAEATSKQFQRERDEELKRKEKEGGSQLRATEAVESERGEAFVKAAAKHEKLQERYQDDAKELKAGHVNVRELEASVAKAETAHAKAQSAVGKVRLAAEEADEAAAKAQGAFDASIGLANSEGKGATKNLPGQLSEVKEELAGRVDQLKGQEMKKVPSQISS